jgi:Zn finger protein HypA/HybF involved in hydrogenase expression
MHEASLAATVLSVLRDAPGPHHTVRVHVWDTSTPAADLADRIATHLATADPPVQVGAVEVVPVPRQRLCATCTTAWTSDQADPACPACDGPALPLPHDHRMEVELPS